MKQALYDWKLDNARKRFLNDPKITEQNKKYVADFLHSYNVKNSTLSKFYDKISVFLRNTQDAKIDIYNDMKLAKIFEKIHKRYSPASYTMTLAATKSLARWLHNDEEGKLPAAFRKIIKLTKEEKETLRKAANSTYETLDWEEGLKLISATNDLQDKAFIMTALDAGMRPQEYLDLNYDDVKRDSKFFILHVKKSKTAKERDVIIYNAAPYLNSWIKAHPFKKGALWIQKRNPNERYTQNAAKKLLATLSNRAGIKKHISMYMLRHSACRLSKLENMNPEMASQKFGHSITFYSEVYGKTTVKDKLDQAKKHYGEKIDKEETEKNKPKVCPVCDTINEPGKDFCTKCNNPLSLAVALKQEKSKDKEIDFLKEQMKSRDIQMAQMIADIADLKTLQAEKEKRKK